VLPDSLPHLLENVAVAEAFDFDTLLADVLVVVGNY
jgi:hypothetical protein